MDRTPPFIESKHLILRLLSPGEGSAAIDYYGSNKEHLLPSGPKWPDNFLTEEFWVRQIERHWAEFEHDVSARMFLFQKNDPAKVIGHASFGAILRGPAQFCYLGYGIAKEKQGNGFMFEILEPTIKYGFDVLKIHRIMANYMPTNERSGRLLKRLGFTIEGYARDYLNLNGKWEDHIMTSITNPNWQEE